MNILLFMLKIKSFLTLSELDIEEEELLEWNLDEKGYYKQGAGLVSTGTNSPRELRPNLWFPILIKEDKIVLPNIEIIKNLYNPLTKEFNDVFLKKYIEEQQKEGDYSSFTLCKRKRSKLEMEL